MLKIEGINETDLEQRQREAEMIYGADDDIDNPLEELPDWEEVDQTGIYTITRLGAGVRDPNRVNVFLDTHFAFSLDVTQVVDLGLKVGQKIDKQRLKELQQASEFGKLYQRTLEWALTRPHSIRETQNYLKRRQIRRRQLNKVRERDGLRTFPEFEDDVLNLVLERMIEKRHLDDRRFAEYYVENRYVKKGISQKRLRLELIKKGVNQELINAAMRKIPRDEKMEIWKVIRKKRAKYNDQKLLNYLVRQGFPFSLAKEALEAYDEDMEIEY